MLTMKKSPASPGKARRRPARSSSGVKKDPEIAATLERLSELQSESTQAASVIQLLSSWLSDESGYDEETWPELKVALNTERRRVGAQSLFDD
jgi:hypothetical protein